MATQPSLLYNNIKETATAFIKAHDHSVASKNVKLLTETLSSDCRRYYAPASILAQVPALAVGMTNQQYEDHMTFEVTEVWAKTETSISDIIVDEHARKGVVVCTHACTTQEGQVWEFEFSWSLHLNEDGSKIVKIVEFIDTALSAKFLSESKALAEHVGQKSR